MRALKCAHSNNINNRTMKVAVLTLFKGNYNYGGMLQSYALPHVIDKMGHKACQIAFGGGIM